LDKSDDVTGEAFGKCVAVVKWCEGFLAVVLCPTEVLGFRSTETRLDVDASAKVDFYSRNHVYI